MHIINASYDIITFQPETDVRDICIGYAACYNMPVPDTFEKQCNYIRKHRNHESQLEHSRLTVMFTINRGIANEIVRHRHSSYGQQSTRYCNYSKDRFGNQLTFIRDTAFTKTAEDYHDWIARRQANEDEYLELIASGFKPEEARGCLPIDIATKLLVTANYREWRNIFKLRCDSHAHYQMREVMKPLFVEVCSALPCVFDDISFD